MSANNANTNADGGVSHTSFMMREITKSKLSLPRGSATLAGMSPDEIETHCMALKGTSRVIQWQGAHVYKIGGKVYAIYADKRDRVTVKCADVETAEFLIEIGVAERAPHLPRGGWISLPADMEPRDLEARLVTSYETVRGALPKSVREALE